MQGFFNWARFITALGQAAVRPEERMAKTIPFIRSITHKATPTNLALQHQVGLGDRL